MAKQEFKVGDLVRVPGRSTSVLCYGHCLPQGSVCEVVRCGHWSGSGVELQLQGEPSIQIVDRSMLKLAKQAMRKREAYANRRG